MLHQMPCFFHQAFSLVGYVSLKKKTWHLRTLRCFKLQIPQSLGPGEPASSVTKRRLGSIGSEMGTAFYTGFHPILGSLFEVTFKNPYDTGWCIGILHWLVTIPINNWASK